MELETMPLRFRVWDNTANKFLENDELLDYSQGFTNFYDKEMIISGGRDFIISQDTGLKDINSKPIYTGDLVKIHEHVGMIAYENGGLGVRFASHELPATTWFGVDEWDETPEVVGNMWQNSELLEIN